MKAAIKYCMNHDILSEFLSSHSSEVMNMLITEWDTEEAKEVWYEEGLEDGLEKGLEKGREEVREEARKEKLQSAANFKKLGVSIEIISQATGLTVEEIKAL